jgi:hypothetical protein
MERLEKTAYELDTYCRESFLRIINSYIERLNGKETLEQIKLLSESIKFCSELACYLLGTHIDKTSYYYGVFLMNKDRRFHITNSSIFDRTTSPFFTDCNSFKDIKEIAEKIHVEQFGIIYKYLDGFEKTLMFDSEKEPKPVYFVFDLFYRIPSPPFDVEAHYSLLTLARR